MIIEIMVRSEKVFAKNWLSEEDKKNLSVCERDS